MAAPRDTAGLQLGDDLVGDFGVKARAVVAGTDSCGVSGHRGSPRRAPEASLPTFNPSRQTRSALSLSTAVTPHALRRNGLRIRTAVFAPGMEARRVKTREAGLQRSRQPGPAGRRRQAYPILGASSCPDAAKTKFFVRSPDRAVSRSTKGRHMPVERRGFRTESPRACARLL